MRGLFFPVLFSMYLSTWCENIFTDIQNKDSQRQNPENNNVDQKAKIVCYYDSMAWYRKKPMDYCIDDIPVDRCTHIIYSFAVLSPQTWKVVPGNDTLDIDKEGYKRFNDLKKKNPKLKTLLSVGECDREHLNNITRSYLEMSESVQKRNLFVESAVDTVLKYGFDGLDLHLDCSLSIYDEDSKVKKEYFLMLVKELREKLDGNGLLLTAAVKISDGRVIHGYDVPELGRLLDQIHVMTYDLRGYKSSQTDVHSPLYKRTFDGGMFENQNVNDGLQKWVDKGAPKHKLIVGIPFYGVTYTLAGTYAELPAATSKWKTNGGEPGSYTMTRGLLAYYEICRRVQSEKWTKKFDDTGKCPYAYHKDQWVGYEDEESIAIKMKFIQEKGYGGGMVWALDLDDFVGICGKKNALLQVMSDGLKDYVVPIGPDEISTTPSITTTLTTPSIATLTTPPITTLTTPSITTLTTPSITTLTTPSSTTLTTPSSTTLTTPSSTILLARSAHLNVSISKYFWDTEKSVCFQRVDIERTECV